MSIKKRIILILFLLGVLVLTKLTFGKTQTGNKDTLDVWLDKLEIAENCPSLGMVDSNGLKSFSSLCFQEQTFVTYVKKYNLLPQCEDQEILNWINDGEFQRVVAKKMLEDNLLNYDHWRNSVKRIGKPIPLAKSYWKQG
jgi:hypothetical protein